MQDIMHVYVTSNFKKGLDQYQLRKSGDTNVLDAQGQLTVVSSLIWRKFEHIQALMLVLVTWKYQKDPIKNNREQVAQRATIAHLSPMCQGQISFKKTYKWAMETRGPKSNSSELLCLSWLPATLMMIWSKMNELAWRHHFPIIRLWEIF